MRQLLAVNMSQDYINSVVSLLHVPYHCTVYNSFVFQSWKPKQVDGISRVAFYSYCWLPRARRENQGYN